MHTSTFRDPKAFGLVLSLIVGASCGPIPALLGYTFLKYSHEDSPLFASIAPLNLRESDAGEGRDALSGWIMYVIKIIG